MVISNEEWIEAISYFVRHSGHPRMTSLLLSRISPPHPPFPPASHLGLDPNCILTSTSATPEEEEEKEEEEENQVWVVPQESTRMFEGIISWILTLILGTFFEDFTQEQVSFGISPGTSPSRPSICLASPPPYTGYSWTPFSPPKVMSCWRELP